MCEMKTIPGVLRNMLNVNLDAGLLLFWTLVCCCFGRWSIAVLDAGLLLFWTLVYCCFGRCALSYGDGLWSAPLAALSVSNRVGSYP
jgi:4-amino-4-deoxy-L-arabinose transferase-like glycosyltransferase